MRWPSWIIIGSETEIVWSPTWYHTRLLGSSLSSMQAELHNGLHKKWVATCAFPWKLRKRCCTGRCSDLEAQSTESIIKCVLRQISNSPRCRKRSAGKVWHFLSHTRNSLYDMSYRLHLPSYIYNLVLITLLCYCLSFSHLESLAQRPWPSVMIGYCPSLHFCLC